MDTEAHRKRITSFEERCRSEGVQATVQRRAIFEVVLDLDHHPTADDVFETVTSRIPGVSRTTVYRTLETLARMQLINRVSHPGSAVRYDRNIDTHHHLLCDQCNEIIDVSDERLDTLPAPDTLPAGFEIIGCNVQFRGICESCRDKEDPS